VDGLVAVLMVQDLSCMGIRSYDPLASRLASRGFSFLRAPFEFAFSSTRGPLRAALRRQFLSAIAVSWALS